MDPTLRRGWHPTPRIAQDAYQVSVKLVDIFQTSVRRSKIIERRKLVVPRRLEELREQIVTSARPCFLRH